MKKFVSFHVGIFNVGEIFSNVFNVFDPEMVCIWNAIHLAMDIRPVEICPLV
jgi:hypothetical protein